MVQRPFLLLSLPIIIYCGFAYGVSVMWSNLVNGTVSVVLSAPPYSFAPSIVGLFYIANLIGATVGSFLTGVVSDWLTIKIARRNGGVVEAESRLWIYLYPTIMYAAAMILWG
ncbi:hypothetical protein PV04_08565 [Phialophora macrospora]|uniref:Major facilitator superfamily (MFS) profile domain-containing protein n=1 Tax=Phialophora macrospora TaxID=1851006 RepID=A0A0D2DMM2_9EURO|nr:hypothetical protein PV04_08565 [Phialophora macrospora]